MIPFTYQSLFLDKSSEIIRNCEYSRKVLISSGKISKINNMIEDIEKFSSVLDNLILLEILVNLSHLHNLHDIDISDDLKFFIYVRSWIFFDETYDLFHI